MSDNTTSPDGLRERIAAAFSGDEYQENAEAAAGEGEWSWFRWLALSTLDAALAAPDPRPDPLREALLSIRAYSNLTGEETHRGMGEWCDEDLCLGCLIHGTAERALDGTDRQPGGTREAALRERLAQARRALIATGYFTEDQVGDDIAPEGER